MNHIRNSISMPLTRGQIVGHDKERLAFAFTMMSERETVQCQISDAAMDELAETKGTPSIARQAQFVAHRNTIERIASDLFDKAPTIKGYVVRIFSKHIQGARRVS
jgi:uncharacterized protein DUF1488